MQRFQDLFFCVSRLLFSYADEPWLKGSRSAIQTKKNTYSTSTVIVVCSICSRLFADNCCKIFVHAALVCAATVLRQLFCYGCILRPHTASLILHVYIYFSHSFYFCSISLWFKAPDFRASLKKTHKNTQKKMHKHDKILQASELLRTVLVHSTYVFRPDRGKKLTCWSRFSTRRDRLKRRMLAL